MVNSLFLSLGFELVLSIILIGLPILSIYFIRRYLDDSSIIRSLLKLNSSKIILTVGLLSFAPLITGLSSSYQFLNPVNDFLWAPLFTLSYFSGWGASGVITAEQTIAALIGFYFQVIYFFLISAVLEKLSRTVFEKIKRKL